MRYWLLAAVSAFSAFAVFAAVGSLVARIAVRLFEASDGRRSPAAEARLLFRLRMLPGWLAVTAAFFIALPIFLWFEEPATTEPVSVTLGVVAAAGLYLLLRAAWRAVSACFSTMKFVREWQRRGRRVADLTPQMPAFAIDETFPMVAVAGIVRPRLFIAERVLRECTAAEVIAMVRHECAHLSARDNVKRLLIRACPDVFGASLRLERAWAAAAEEAADAAAARQDPSVRLDLAQALIRVARLAAPRAPELVSAFYLDGRIDARVRRLIDPPPVDTPPRWSRWLVPLTAVLTAAAIVVAAPWLHAIMELAIRLLP